MRNEARKLAERPLQSDELIRVVRQERGRHSGLFLSQVDKSNSSLFDLGYKWYPSPKTLSELSLTPRSWLALTEFQTIPGGAGGKTEVVLAKWLNTIKYLKNNTDYLQKGGRIQILAAIHGTFPSQILMQRKDGTKFFAEVGGRIDAGVVPADTPNTETMAGTSSILHAECSCGASGGRSENIRWKAGENVIQFLNTLRTFHSPIVKQISVLPIEAVVSGFNLTEKGWPDIRFLVGQSLTVENMAKYLNEFREPFLPPSRNYPDKIITGEQLDAKIRHTFDQGIFISGTACVDSRQNFLTPPHNHHPVSLGDVPHAWNADDDWQGVAHTEFAGVTVFDKDKKMLRLAYELATEPFYFLRTTNWANQNGSPSFPFLLNIDWNDIDGNNGKWLKTTLQNLFSAMDTEVYRRTADTGYTPTKTFIRRKDERITEIDLGRGFKLFADKEFVFFDQIRPGILKYPAFARENRGQVWPLTKKNDLVIKV